jgi:IPT/TIG domain
MRRIIPLILTLVASLMFAVFSSDIVRAEQKPKLIDVSSSVRAVGIDIYLTGRNFDSQNTVHIGSMTIKGVPVASKYAIACTTDPNCISGIVEKLVVSVPSNTVGDYTISVENSNGSSNTINFLVHK